MQPKPQDALRKPVNVLGKPQGLPVRNLIDMLDEIEELKQHLSSKNKDVSVQIRLNEEVKKENQTLADRIEAVKKSNRARVAPEEERPMGNRSETDPELDRIRQIEMAMRMREADKRRRERDMWMMAMHMQQH